MSAWASLLVGLVRLLSFVASRVSDEELRRAGEERLALSQLEELHDRIKAAAAARAREPAPGGLRDDDGHRRD